MIFLNKTERKRLDKIRAAMEELRQQIEDVHTEAQERFDGKSDRWQEGEKGEAAQTELDSLQQAYDDADNLVSLIADDLVGDLDE